MNRKTLLLVTLLFVFGVVVYLLAGKESAEINENTYPAVSTDSAEYQKCVDNGGAVSDEIAPARCVIDDKAYHNGNF